MLEGFVAAKKARRHGLMQQLLTGRVWFKEFNGAGRGLMQKLLTGEVRVKTS